MSAIEPLFRALNEASVRYVVVGGLAVVLHGHARMTADVDLIVDLDEEQARKAIEVLVGIGLQARVPVDPLDFARRAVREQWIRDRGMQVFTLVDPVNPIRVVDLFVQEPIPFEDLWSRSIQLDLSHTTVRVASIPDLIRLKEKSDRPLDRSDIEQLREIQKRKTREMND